MQRGRQAIVVGTVQGVFSIVVPAECRIALRLPYQCLARNGRLPLIKAGYVTERDGGFLKGTLLKLRLAQQHPGIVQEGVELPPCQPLPVFGSIGPTRRTHRTTFDGVSPDGLLRLLYGTVELGRAKGGRSLVAHGIERNHFQIIVLIAFLLRQQSGLVSLIAVEVNVVTGGQCMIKAAACRILARRTACEQGK